MPPGWYPAQHAQGQLRYWDGVRWLESSPGTAVRSKNPLGIVALVIAIVGAVFACVPGALIVGWMLLPTAFVLGLVAVALPHRSRGAAIASIIVAVVGTVVGFVVFLVVVGSAFSNATSGGVEGFSGGGSSAASEAPANGGSQKSAAVPDGFKDTGKGVALRFLDDPSCGQYTRCSQVEVFALRDCPNSVYVEANMLDSSGRNVGLTNDILGSLKKGATGVVDLMIFDDRAERVELSQVNCY